MKDDLRQKLTKTLISHFPNANAYPVAALEKLFDEHLQGFADEVKEEFDSYRMAHRGQWTTYHSYIKAVDRILSSYQQADKDGGDSSSAACTCKTVPHKNLWGENTKRLVPSPNCPIHVADKDKPTNPKDRE